MKGLIFDTLETGKEMMQDILETLPKYHRQAVYLRFYESLLIGEIAEEMGVSWSKANQLIDQGLDMMKKILLTELDKKKSA